MKKLTEEEAKKLTVKGKRKATPVFEEILNLKSGEYLQIEPKDWTRKSSPSKVCRYIEKRYSKKYECRPLTHKQGWLIKCF